MAGLKPLLDTVGALIPKIGEGIRAWHTSPYDFDKFDLSKIGTGQGAATYGKGIYAAENPAVSGLGGEYWKEFTRHPATPYPDVADLLRSHNFDRAAAIKAVQKNVDELRSYGTLLDPSDPAFVGGVANYPAKKAQAEKLLKRREEELALLQKPGQQIGPRVYDLNIKAEPNQFLNWDVPLAQQPDAVRELVDKAPPTIGGNTFRGGQIASPTGEDIFRRLGGVEPGSAAAGIGLGKDVASQTLREAGIPGIRYLDQGSRNAGTVARLKSNYDNLLAELNSSRRGVFQSDVDVAKQRYEQALAASQKPTYNYVVNNPDIIEIMRKLAIPGVVGGGAASVYQPQGQR